MNMQRDYRPIKDLLAEGNGLVAASGIRHVVIIPDGNGRWAQRHGVPIPVGHFKGAETARNILEICRALGIEVVTFWGFSIENCQRPAEEIAAIMNAVEYLIDREGERLVREGVIFRHIGRKERLPASVLKKISELEKATSANREKTLVLALYYGGRDEIVRAINKVLGKEHEIKEEEFSRLLDTHGLPDPDLIIRTGGEMRTSGVYPWQAVYAEYVSSAVLWPDFDMSDLIHCIREYSHRQRRFGRRVTQQQQSSLAWLGLQETSFKGFLDAFLPNFEQSLGRLLANWRTERLYSAPPLQQDIAKIESLLREGKRVRAASVVLGYEIAGGEPAYRDEVIDVAVAYEMIHNSFLVHDDIEDNSPLRRNRPTIHEQYRQEHEMQGGLVDHLQYGVGNAINLGSLMAFKALRTMWGKNIPQNRILEGQRWVQHVMETTLVGQRRDLADLPLRELTRREVYFIYHQKTAIYTLVGPLKLGAILAGASRKDLKLINTFGVLLGVAFQIIDDDLGLYGNELVLGKPVGSDLAEAKKTLHFIYVCESDAPLYEKKFLETVWGEKGVTVAELEQVRRIVSAHARKHVLRRADMLALQAKRVIPQITSDTTLKQILESMADFVVQRQY